MAIIRWKPKNDHSWCYNHVTTIVKKLIKKKTLVLITPYLFPKWCHSSASLLGVGIGKTQLYTAVQSLLFYIQQTLFWCQCHLQMGCAINLCTILFDFADFIWQFSFRLICQLENLSKYAFLYTIKKVKSSLHLNVKIEILVFSFRF